MGMEAHRVTWASRPSCYLTSPDNSQLDLLLRAGIEMSALMQPIPIMIATGEVGHDDRFEPTSDGESWFAFGEPSAKDVVFWHQRSGRLTSDSGHAFALGGSVIVNPSTYALGGSLNIFADPFEWLRERRDGIVVMPRKWPLLFDQVRDVPRVVLSPHVVSSYKRHMRPARLPRVFVAAHALERPR